jgi:protein involved in polysaccharide export with SLBB domain
MVEGIYKLKVSREGTVILPKVGVVSVAGLRFGSLKENLQQNLSKYYRDFNLNVSLSNLRTIRVYVVGEIQNPGSYILSSLSTVYNALFAAGGPSKNGTLRDIRLIREGKVIAHLDLYDFLLQGNREQDQNLQTGDTIFIPLIGPVVGLAGNVKRPAIYELKGPETLESVFKLAGGVMPTGYLSRVQVERIVSNEKRVVADFDLSKEGLEKKRSAEFQIPVLNMDLIKVSSILDTRENVVYLEGYVTRPGTYELKEGMRVNDLVASFEDLLPEPYLPHAEIIRLVPPDLHPETLSFDVGRMLEGDKAENLVLQSRDRVVIFQKVLMEESPVVRITGNVQRPGKYPLMENMTLKDLLFKAGNVTRNAFMEQAELVRTVRLGNQTEQKRIPVHLQSALEDRPGQNISLQPDDHLFIREIPEWFVNKTISLSGEVLFPGVYAFRKGERLSDVLERAGGFTEKAYLPGAVFTRQTVKELEKEHLDRFLAKQKQRLATEAAAVAASGLDKEEIQSETFQLAQRKESLDLLASQVKLGRVVIHLSSLDDFRNSPNDFELEDQDSLYVPAQPSSVAILGAVRNPTSFLFEEKRRVNFYINKAGGYTEDAEQKGVYVLRSDGSATSLGHLVHLEPGDAVIVPAKLEVKYRPIQLWRDIATIVGQFALTVAAIASIL